MHVRFMQVKERALDNLQFGIALSCAASVVKADHVQDRATTSRVYER